MVERLRTPEGRGIAVERVPGEGPTVVFLGGFRSDMTGTKAVFLEDRARARGRAFLRFDYSGHGQSEGRFEDGCIGDWLEDARAVLATVAGPVVLVGSSMGGWISLLLARERPVAGLVTIAAAPDFTDAMWAEFTAAQRAEVMQGVTLRPSDYGDPYPITRRLIEDGRTRRIFDRPLSLPMPTRFLQGTADADVPQAVALRLLDHAQGPDIRLTLVKGADHRFSDPACLTLIAQAVQEVGG
jgi:pimeloyl-ACP methyl ester carboxylesterase